MRYNASQLAELGEISTEYYSNRSESPSSFPTYWCGRIVPYEFDSSFTGSYQNEALYAMSLISSSCGVDVVPATYQTDRIVFHVSNGNNSPVGKEGGSQVINIYNCNYGVIMHEILHSLGFHHEHSRNDRDDYLDIKWLNIKPSQWHNFTKHSIGLCLTSLDFNSIMMYGSLTSDTDFVYDTSKPMFTDLNGGYIYEQRDSLSTCDILDLQNIYGPPFHEMEVSHEVIRDYYEYGTEIYEEIATFTLKFYADDGFTIPVLLPTSRSIIIRETVIQSDVNQIIHYGSVDRVVIVPAGVSSYVVGSHYNYDNYAYGSPSYVDIVSYSVVNWH